MTSVIVVGGSGYLGRHSVAGISRLGFRVVNLDRHAPEQYVAGERFIQVDIADSVALYAALSELDTMPVFGLVFLAFSRPPGFTEPLPGYDDRVWDEVLDVGLTSFYRCCKVMLPRMIQLPDSRVVAIGSLYGARGPDQRIYAFSGGPALTPMAYSAAKAGISGAVRWIAATYGERGVRANTVSPGGIFNNHGEGFAAAYGARVPLGEMGLPADVAAVVCALLADAGRYISGQEIMVDGGVSAW